VTIDQLIARKKSEIAAQLAKRAANVKELSQLREKTEMSEGDEARASELLTENEGIDTAVSALRADAARYEAEQAADEAADALARSVTETTVSPSTSRAAAVVTSEERTYHPGNDPRGENFMRDVARAFMGDFGARERTQRHMQEEVVERGAEFEQRAVSTGAFAGLVVPQYLTDLVAPAAAAARPFADICNKHELPAVGTTVNISRITTATSAAAQSAENAAVSSTDIDDTLLTETMFTVAGQQVMSRQSIERGVGTEEITLNDLVRRYHSALDSKLLNDATTGLTNVAQSVAYTDASPTAAELYPKLLNAQANLEAVMLDQGVGDVYAVMHSRRWAWLQSQVGTSWPFISQPGIPTQAGGVATSAGYAQGVRGVLPNGVKVIVDNNIATNLGAGTNEDEVYIVNASELHLWEDSSAPLFIRAEQTNAASLGVLLVVYGYAAYSFRRYTNGHQKIAGTGLVTPTF
jgi:hypothetical protein